MIIKRGRRILTNLGSISFIPTVLIFKQLEQFKIENWSNLKKRVCMESAGTQIWSNLKKHSLLVHKAITIQEMWNVQRMFSCML